MVKTYSLEQRIKNTEGSTADVGDVGEVISLGAGLTAGGVIGSEHACQQLTCLL